MNARLGMLMLFVMLATAAAGQQTTFQVATSSVPLDVSVMRDGKPVAGLTASDFQLTDNGVRQAITDVSREQLRVDVTLIADLSGTAEGPRLDAFRRALSQTRRSLGPGDRARLVLFDPRIREIEGLEKEGELVINSDVRALDGGASALLDALAVSLIRKPDPFYRRMAFVFTDGQDGGSFVDERKLLDVAARTDMAVFAVALTDGTTRTPRRPSNERMLQALADTSGGALTVVQRDADLGASFVRKLEEFRTSYVLRYSPTGVPVSGWHDVEVRLGQPGRFDVRARKGYFAETAAESR